MGRTRSLVAVLLGALVSLPSVAAAQGAPAGSKNTAITFAVGRLAGDYTLKAEGRGFTFFKRVGPSKVIVRLQVPGDIVEVEADSSGAARLVRNGKDVRFQMRQLDQTRQARLQRLAAGSRAIAAFEAMMATLESNDTPEARSLSTSYALVQAVRGNGDASRTLAIRLKPQAALAATRVSTRATEEIPVACWADYAQAVNGYLHEFSACVLDYGWIPGMSAVCAFEFSVKAELAWFWLIGCSGGFPV